MSREFIGTRGSNIVAPKPRAYVGPRARRRLSMKGRFHGKPDDHRHRKGADRFRPWVDFGSAWRDGAYRA